LSATLVTWLSIPIDALSSWKNNGFGGYTFTYMIDPSSVADMVKAQQDAMSRRLQRKLASMTDTAAILNTLIAAKLSDGSLTVLVAGAGLASGLGYDSVDALMNSVSQVPVVVAQPVTGSFSTTLSFSGLPDSAFVGGKLTASALSVITNGVTAALEAAGGSSGSSATITTVQDAATGTVLYSATSSRRVLAGNPSTLAITFSISAPSATALNAAKAAVSSSTFFSSVVANMVSDPNGGGAFGTAAVVVYVAPASAATDPNIVNGVNVKAAWGTTVGVVLFVSLIAAVLFCKRSAPAAKEAPASGAAATSVEAVKLEVRHVEGASSSTAAACYNELPANVKTYLKGKGAVNSAGGVATPLKLTSHVTTDILAISGADTDKIISQLRESGFLYV